MLHHLTDLIETHLNLPGNFGRRLDSLESFQTNPTLERSVNRLPFALILMCILSLIVLFWFAGSNSRRPADTKNSVLANGLNFGYNLMAHPRRD